MGSMLMENSRLTCSVGEIIVKNLLGSGGQGEVYKVDIGAKSYALKWYYPNVITQELKASIQTLVDKKTPSTFFLWPITTVTHGSGFGYIMGLRPSNFSSLQDWVRRKFDMDVSKLAHACMQLCDSFHLLHSKGLSYQDISLGNVFLNKDTGDVLICDNDNVTVNGQTVGSVLGTPKFMAPELVDRTKRFPDAQTDRFSLAVLLFNLLMIGHPFDGAMEMNVHCLDLKAAEKLLYNKDAIFIFHPTNNKNRPDVVEHASVINLWKIYPNYIKDLFMRTFTEGVVDPTKRVRESEWREAFIHLQANAYKCNCGREIIYNPENLKSAKSMRCGCGKEIVYPPRMKINQYVVLLNNGRKLYKTYVDKSDENDLQTVYAEFKYKNGELYIKNFCGQNITHIDAYGNKSDIKNDATCKIKTADNLNIMGAVGEIRF